MRLYESIAAHLPAGYRKGLYDSFKFAGFDERKIVRLIGFLLVFSIGIGIVTFALMYVFELGLLLAAIGGFVGGVIALIGLQTGIALIGDARSRNIDAVLPDCLQLIASNIRAGVTVDQAIWLSARPEFGILEDEVRRVGTKTIGGTPLGKALFEMSDHIRSDMLDRAVKLLVEGMEAGGEIAHLLEETSANIRTAHAMRKEIKAAVVMYTILILFAAVFGAPLLFAISIQFVSAISSMSGSTSMMSSAPTLEGSGMASSFGMIKNTAPALTEDELLYFAIAAISLTTFFGALIISLIQNGEERRGIKYVPLFMATALGIFFVARVAVSSLLSFV